MASFLSICQLLHGQRNEEANILKIVLACSDDDFKSIADVSGFFQATKVLKHLTLAVEREPSLGKVVVLERNARYGILANRTLKFVCVGTHYTCILGVMVLGMTSTGLRR